MSERNADSRYEQMTVEELFLEASSFERMLNMFLEIAEYPNDLKYIVDVRAVVEILTRVDKRTAYYSFFHDGNKIHEMKRVGILVYWLLKFKPITITDDRIVKGSLDAQEEAFHINESFALSLVYSGLMNYGNLKTVPKKDSKLHKALLYAFKYREMSQDSIMTLVYSLCKILP
jgi:hypothetical protein